MRDAVQLHIPVGPEWSPSALHEHVIHFCFENGLLEHGDCEDLEEALRKYALHIKGTDFFLPRFQGGNASPSSSPQDRTKSLPSTWMRKFCDAALAYEQRIAGVESDSLFGDNNSLSVTVAHCTQWSELQSYQGYAAQVWGWNVLAPPLHRILRFMFLVE